MVKPGGEQKGGAAPQISSRLCTRQPDWPTSEDRVGALPRASAALPEVPVVGDGMYYSHGRWWNGGIEGQSWSPRGDLG